MTGLHLVNAEPVADFESCRKVAQEPRRGYVAWRPTGKTKRLLADVQLVFEEYAEQLPLTVRQVYYRLIGAYGYDKTDKLYASLIYMLGRARRARIIPFDWLRDDGISVVAGQCYGEPADFWDHVAIEAHGYRRDKQQGQPVGIEVWTEATGMLPQIAAVANDYSVPVYSATGGFSGLCGVRLIVDHALARNVPTVLLHIGDFDPHGEDIFTAITEDAKAFLAEDRIIGTQRIHAERVALTSGQVDEHELPTDELKTPSTKQQAAVQERWLHRHGNRTCQCEALPPDVLADLVREAIEAHLRPDVLAAHEAAEKRERVQLLRALPAGTP